MDVDWIYVHYLLSAAEMIKMKYKAQYVAFGYTQIKTQEARDMVSMLADVGIVILRSNVPTPRGAILWPHNDISALKERFPHLKLAKCPAQNSKWTSCRTCQICWKVRETNVTVVFEASYNKKHKLDLGAILTQGEAHC